MDVSTISASCRGTVLAAREALAWVGDPRNARKLSQERAPVEQKLRRVLNEAGRLERSIERPTCVGVFGPSQAGKSYLISILARKDHAPLIATFDGDRPEVDFIKDINPIGGDESTGVVTRFTIRPFRTPPGFPVGLRLLTQTDVVKILVNSYFQDGDQEYETVMDTASLEKAVTAAEALGAASPVDPFTEDDIWDIQDYIQKNAGGAASATALDPFWTRIAAIAPRLPLADRATLLSLLWGRHDTYTRIYLRLVQALGQLDFAEDAYCAIDALIPSRESIINVNALDAIHDVGAIALQVCTLSGRVVTLPRPIVTALTAELQIVCRDRPLPFFDHTDLLDFPGYRTRFKRDLKRYFRDASDTASKDVFLRGKVDYLFQRYTAALELTAMILCIADSVMEVANLPKAVESWVGVTHGASPEKRAGKPALLFFAMTKFDRTLERKAGGEDGNMAEKFEIRFKASLFSPFAKVEPSWVRQWAPRQPFRNVFLIRNPNVRFLGVIDYMGATETGYSAAESPRLAALRQAFVDLPLARDHFQDPGRAWDALMALNDGGIGHLAEALEKVCVPGLKQGQVAARIAEISRDLGEMLQRYYVSEDFLKRRDERLTIVDEVIFPRLNHCAKQGSFGSALRGLMINGSDLYGTLMEAINRPEKPAAAAEAEDVDIFTRRRRKAAPDVNARRTDRSAALAVAALSCWASFLQKRVENPVFARRVSISTEVLQAIVAEVGNAARRLDLAERIASELRVRSAPNDQPEAVVRKAVVIAERVVNRFVSELGFDQIDADEQERKFAQAQTAADAGEDLPPPVFLSRPPAFDIAGIGPDPKDYTTEYMADWAEAFRTAVAENAMSKEGMIDDPAQNARLGKIIRSLGS